MNSPNTAQENLSQQNARKNTKPRNILITQYVKLDASSSHDLSMKLPPINTNSDYQHSQFGQYSRYNKTDQQDNGFNKFINQFKKNSSTTKFINTKPSHRQSNDGTENIEQARVTGFKKINESLPPRVTRLLHAVEDRDAKQSRQILSKFTNKDQEKEYMMPRTFTLDSFKLVRSQKNTPKIKHLICHFINNHKKYFNKEVVNLPNYQKSAPFFIETMSFADNYIDDQKLVQKNFGYDEQNLQRNNLILEKILLERLLKQEQSIPQKLDLDQISIITQHIN